MIESGGNGQPLSGHLTEICNEKWMQVLPVRGHRAGCGARRRRLGPGDSEDFLGDPDLQGIWVGSTLTPLERPAEYQGRELLNNAPPGEHQGHLEVIMGRILNRLRG